MKSFRMPTAYTILLSLLLVMTILTWVIPAGRYQTGAEGEPVSGTYEQIPQQGQPITSVFTAPLEGLYEAIDIAAFILMVGGFLGVVGKTGAIDRGISALVAKLRGKETLLIPILMLVFALGGTTFGMAEETIAFYPLVLPILVSAGYDPITAVAVILVGAGVGTLASTVNPFATGIAAGFAGVSLGTGMLLRVIMLVVMLAASIYFVMRYAARVKAHPETSLMASRRADYTARFAAQGSDGAKLSWVQSLALALFALTFLVMIYAVIPFDDMGLPLPTLGWWFPQLSALFLAASILVGVCCGLGEEETVGAFIHGAADLLGVAFIIGISRGITVIMNGGQITATVLYWGEQALRGAGAVSFTLLTFLLYLPLSFLIPSSSGLATLSMPIMAPLADFAGVGREVVITAFQTASGLINLITPTSAVVMGALALGHVPYGAFLKFIWKLLAILLVLSLMFLALGALA